MDIMSSNYVPMSIGVHKKTQSFKSIRSNFTSEFDSFAKKQVQLKEKDLVQKLKEIVAEKFKDRASFIHKGEDGQIFKIDDFLVFKVEHGKAPVVEKIYFNQDTKFDGLKTYYGATLAKSGNVEILRNASADKKAIPAGLVGEFANQSEKIQYYNEVYLQKYSSLPQSAYDNITADFKELNAISEEGKFFTFDTINPNNFIAVEDKIFIVDKLDKTSQKEGNTTAKMINVFINSLSHDTKAEFDVLSVGSRRNIFKKCIIAGEKADLPYGRSTQERQDLNDALQLCDIQENFSEIQRTLMDYKRKYPDMQERTNKISEYLDELTMEDNIFNTAHFFE